MKQPNKCRGVSHTPSMAAWMPINRWCLVERIHFNFAHIRAYAIRPYTYSVDFRDLLGCVLISISLTSGRMRYAPTHVRLIFGICWVGGWFRFRSHQGVCDTPLHTFGWNLGFVGLRVGFVSAHIRAYAIRPYTCSMKIECLSHKNFTSNDFC